MSTKVNSLQVVSSTIDSSPIGSSSPSTAQFITPGAGDNSQNAATTAWVTAALAGTQSGSGSLPLPGGLVIKWGVSSTITATSGSGTGMRVSFPASFPSNCFTVVGTINGNNDRVGYMSGFDAGGFNVGCNGSGSTFSWIAIGN